MSSTGEILEQIRRLLRDINISALWWRLDPEQIGSLSTVQFVELLDHLQIQATRRAFHSFLALIRAHETDEGDNDRVSYKAFSTTVREYREKKQTERREKRIAAELAKERELESASSEVHRYRLDALKLRLQHEREEREERRRLDKIRDEEERKARIAIKIERLKKERERMLVAEQAKAAQTETATQRPSAQVARSEFETLWKDTVAKYIPVVDATPPEHFPHREDGTISVRDIAVTLQRMGVDVTRTEMLNVVRAMETRNRARMNDENHDENAARAQSMA